VYVRADGGAHVQIFLTEEQQQSVSLKEAKLVLAVMPGIVGKRKPVGHLKEWDASGVAAG
jgi:hypothetical protein